MRPGAIDHQYPKQFAETGYNVQAHIRQLRQILDPDHSSRGKGSGNGQLNKLVNIIVLQKMDQLQRGQQYAGPKHPAPLHVRVNRQARAVQH